MIDWLSNWMNLVELAAILTGLANVWLTTRQNIWCWPVGLVMVSLYIVIFYEARLYSDMGLQVVYIFMQVYGWYYWLRGGNTVPGTVHDTVEGQDGPGDQEARVSRLSPRWLIACAASALLGTAGLGYLMDTFTDADLAYWDAATTVLSLLAQWLLGRKILESWVVWIMVDVLAIGIYFTKGLYLTGGLYVVFLGLATSGLVQWWKSFRQAEPAASAPAA